MTNPTSRLTSEQEQVVHHPLGYHARVLAVAGSGKSTHNGPSHCPPGAELCRAP